MTNGIRFTLDTLELGPQDRVVVVRDSVTFATEYGGAIAVAGQHGGSLSKAAERLTLKDATGGVILDFAYRDAWHRAADGQGHSLIVVDSGSSDPSLRSDEATWAMSAAVGGSPGYWTGRCLKLRRRPENGHFSAWQRRRFWRCGFIVDGADAARRKNGRSKIAFLDRV
ncbi:MAG: hypothetical protein IIA65_09845 [Planctomycetes bacterium]|nr:hypothetical protein [Planctomycetota bacterium]